MVASEEVKPVTVSLEALEDGTVPLAVLEEAFGPDSLGILIVSGLPTEFGSLRKRVLSSAARLAALPASELGKLENAQAKWLVGWSRGREKLKSDKPDTLKGSYYINCAYNAPAAPLAARYADFPEYTAPNVWPDEQLMPGFRAASEQLTKLIIGVAALVARACDRFAAQNIQGYEAGYLERVVRTSNTTKARLLHYFPVGEARENGGEDAKQQQQQEEEEDSWCATHLDHGCLTGLTSALYADSDSACPEDAAARTAGETPGAAAGKEAELEEIECPDPRAGLYIHSRSQQVTKVSIPRDCLAFQTGEALQLITKGRFRAVPHFVRGITPPAPASASARAAQVSRNTLAVFTQPNLWEKVSDEATFADFARGVVSRNY